MDLGLVLAIILAASFLPLLWSTIVEFGPPLRAKVTRTIRCPADQRLATVTFLVDTPRDVESCTAFGEGRIDCSKPCLRLIGKSRTECAELTARDAVGARQG